MPRNPRMLQRNNWTLADISNWFDMDIRWSDDDYINHTTPELQQQIDQLLRSLQWTAMNDIWLHLCSNGYLCWAKWFHQQYAENQMAEQEASWYYYEIGFQNACMNGHLSMAQWLLSIRPPEVGDWSKGIFVTVCQYGYLSLAQWLYSIQPTLDINMLDQSARKYAHLHGHQDVVNWLDSL